MLQNCAFETVPINNKTIYDMHFLFGIVIENNNRDKRYIYRTPE